MSFKTQTAHMKRLGNLLSQDLSYIYGERESGPNGAKKDFLHKGAVFFRALAKDLGFTQSKVYSEKAGIACSGEIYLYGIWGEGNGLFIELSQMHIKDYCVMYRTVTAIKGGKHGNNQFISKSVLQKGDYASLLYTFLSYRKTLIAVQNAA